MDLGSVLLRQGALYAFFERPRYLFLLFQKGSLLPGLALGSRLQESPCSPPPTSTRSFLASLLRTVMSLLMKITGNVLGARPSSHPVSPQAFPGETWRCDNSPSWKSRPVCELFAVGWNDSSAGLQCWPAPLMSGFDYLSAITYGKTI